MSGPVPGAGEPVAARESGNDGEWFHYNTDGIGPGDEYEHHDLYTADQLRAAVDAERKRRHCGCAWCCASTPPERRGETHKRTCLVGT